MCPLNTMSVHKWQLLLCPCLSYSFCRVGKYIHHWLSFKRICEFILNSFWYRAFYGVWPGSTWLSFDIFQEGHGKVCRKNNVRNNFLRKNHNRIKQKGTLLTGWKKKQSTQNSIPSENVLQK